MIADKQIETSVLSGLIIDPNTQHLLTELKADFFTEPHHMAIFTAMDELRREGSHIDMMTVVTRCRQKGVATIKEVAEVANSLTSAANIETHCKFLYQFWALRNLQMIGHRLTALNHSNDPFAISAEVQTQIDNVITNIGGEPKAIGDVMMKSFLNIEKRIAAGQDSIGQPSGWFKFDNLLGGFVPGELIIVAGRPGMGKTAFAMSMAQAHAKMNGSILFFSLEMSNDSLAQRVWSSEGIDSADLRKVNLTKKQLAMMADQFPKYDRMKLFIEDTRTLTIEQIRSRVRQMKNKHGLTLVVIDYIGLINTESKDIREQQIAKISRTAKIIAGESQVCVMLLAQLNREVEKREDKRPKLSDLRESGAIEQDADAVLFPYRPKFAAGESSFGMEEAEIIIGKNRNGSPNHDLGCWFDAKHTSYVFQDPVHESGGDFKSFVV